MTLLGHLIHFFPLLTFALIAWRFTAFVAAPGWLTGGELLAALYLFPLAAYRIHQYLFPLREGVEVVSERRYCRWWGSYQIQVIYYVLPQLEWVLRQIPGAYSAWLRLWGSRIGRGVYWSPNVEVLDRGLVEVGDHVVFGHKAKLISHVACPKRGRMIVYVKRIRIGSRSFVGAFSGLGPGAQIGDEVFLPIMSKVLVNEHAL
jgi:hypothetical protein